MRLLSCMTCSLVPSPPPQLSSLAVRTTLLTVTRTASDESCGGRQATRPLASYPGHVATRPPLLQSCLWGPEDFPTELIKKEPTARL